ncbi:MAG: tail fiber domain-containing protein [Bacteroidota bacterium]
MKQVVLFGLVQLFLIQVSGQVSINSNGTPPHASAMFDINASNKGLLIPRVALSGTKDNNTITAPAHSLLIFNTATAGTKFVSVTPGFYYWNNITQTWTALSVADNSMSNGWLLNGNTGISASDHFLGTTDNQPLTFRVNNLHAGQLSAVNRNAAFGVRALASNTTGYNNVAIGAGALEKNTLGHGMVAIGDSALFNQLTNGSNFYSNTAVGSKSLYSNISGYGNTAVGVEALVSSNTSFNTALGFWSLRSNTFGSGNVAVGASSLEKNTSGENNTALGFSALNRNSNNSNNTAVGYQSLYYNDANENTATGYTALRNNTTGTKNSAFGLSALLSNNTGSYNTAVGNSAAWNSEGNWNTAVGYNAMYNTDAGQANVAIGYQAMLHNIMGSNNTAIGTNAGPGAGGSAFSNSTAIGQGAAFTASNQVRVGNTLVTAIGGYADFVKISDIRFKKNVKAEIHGLDFILKLEPIVYNMDLQKLNKFIYGKASDTLFTGQQMANLVENETTEISGFSAQQVEAVAKAIGYNFNGVHRPESEQDHYSLSYASFVVPLVKSVQEQQQIISDQQIKINSQEKRINDQQAAIDSLLLRMSTIEKINSSKL